MRWTRSLPRRLAAAAAGLMLACLTLAVVGAAGPNRPPGPAPARPVAADPAPLFARTEPAANRPVLVLQPDGPAVRGWVAGGKSFAGARVTGKVDGKTTTAVV